MNTSRCHNKCRFCNLYAPISLLPTQNCEIQSLVNHLNRSIAERMRSASTVKVLLTDSNLGHHLGDKSSTFPKAVHHRPQLLFVLGLDINSLAQATAESWLATNTDLLNSVLSAGYASEADCSGLDARLARGELFLTGPHSNGSPHGERLRDILVNSGLADPSILQWIEPLSIHYPSAAKPTAESHITDTMMRRPYASLQEIYAMDQRQQLTDLVYTDVASLSGSLAASQAWPKSVREWFIQCWNESGGRLTEAEIQMFLQSNSEHCRHHIFNAEWLRYGVRYMAHLSGDGKDAPAEVTNSSLFDAIKSTSYLPAGEELRIPNVKNKLYRRGLISCYSDNAAVFEGYGTKEFFPDPNTKEWVWQEQPQHIVAKAETHNHPTGIAPWPGAATGVGGEIRDEAAVGRGAYSKAGFSGYIVSDLGLPILPSPQEVAPFAKMHVPNALFATSRRIMAEAPLGAAAYGNEFGRPQLAGFFRTFEAIRPASDMPSANAGKKYQTKYQYLGYDKPVMLAGGLGSTDAPNALKVPAATGSYLIVLGGKSYAIGIGGGAASSKTNSGSQAAFMSVQRAFPEMQKRAQSVIDTCRHYGKNNPILFIHDVGAGGLSNAITELLKDVGKGVHIDPAHIPVGQSLTPSQLWCNESQERFVLAVEQGALDQFTEICRRERCPFGILGKLNESDRIILKGSTEIPFTLAHTLAPTKVQADAGHLSEQELSNTMVDKPLNWLFDYEGEQQRVLFEPKLNPTTLAVTEPDWRTGIKLLQEWSQRWAGTDLPTDVPLDTLDKDELRKRMRKLMAALGQAVMGYVAVASKAFLIHIADRNVGGLTSADQLVGESQVPIADCAVTLCDVESRSGELCALGERPAIAVNNPSASVRMALAEVVTNAVAGGLDLISDLRLSANWMAPCADAEVVSRALGGEQMTADDLLELESDAHLHAGVNALSELCQSLEIAIPVGKDSLSMRSSTWKDRKHADWVPHRDTAAMQVQSPLTAVLSGFAPVKDVSATLKPLLRSGDSVLLRVSLGSSRRLGGSIAAQVATSVGHKNGTPHNKDTDDLAAQVSHVTDWATPDVENTGSLKLFTQFITALRQRGLVWAYHDISDGGLCATLAEMCFASRCGMDIDLTSARADSASEEAEARWWSQWGRLATELYSEEAGAVIQVARHSVGEVLETLTELTKAGGFDASLKVDNIGFPLTGYNELETVSAKDFPSVGEPSSKKAARHSLWLTIRCSDARIDLPLLDVVEKGDSLPNKDFKTLYRAWNVPSDVIRLSRGDNPDMVREEYHSFLDRTYGLEYVPNNLSDHTTKFTNNQLNGSKKDRYVAILREQGTNSDREMAAAFYRAGLIPVDVHTTDLVTGHRDLEEFDVLAFCGGFSYGDELGAGVGWSSVLLNSPRTAQGLRAFFADENKLVLGVCNGCQVLSHLKSVIPGASHWPDFKRNLSQRHESRWVNVDVNPKCESVWLQGLAGWRIPIPVSHGEGRAIFAESAQPDNASATIENDLPVLLRGDAKDVALCYRERGAAQNWHFAPFLPSKSRPESHDSAPNSETLLDRRWTSVSYPSDPNGSDGSVAAVTAAEGRVLALMPHPERAVRFAQWSWHPRGCDKFNDSPWQKLFNNAAKWLQLRS